jgi:hypothetical protein
MFEVFSRTVYNTIKHLYMYLKHNSVLFMAVNYMFRTVTKLSSGCTYIRMTKIKLKTAMYATLDFLINLTTQDLDFHIFRLWVLIYRLMMDL